ncbi:MAG: hypothetical protein Tsb0034_19670 [Ekhidna sp.]
MSKSFFFSLIVIGLSLGSCSSNNAEDAAIDCNASDLSIEKLESTKPDCDTEGSITVIGEGGKQPYSFSLNGVDFQPDGVFAGLSAGTYSLSVRDDNGCTEAIDVTLESGPNGITIDVATSETECDGETGSITITASGGAGDYTFQLNDQPAVVDNVFDQLGIGSYSVKVIDAEGCEAERDVLVPANVSLLDDIMPIINASCAITGCHNGTRSPNLTTPEAVISNASRIKSETQSRSMPRDDQLEQSEIDLIACWVDSGAKNN